MNVLMQTMSLMDQRLARNERQMSQLRDFVLSQSGGRPGEAGDIGAGPGSDAEVVGE